eukprot:TCONS_00053748-protein
MEVKDIINVTLYLISVILHSFGFIVLWKVPVGPNLSSTQRIYLLNISCCELVSSIIFVAIRFFLDNELFEAAVHLYKIAISGLYFWYIGLMILMTFDRFLMVYLNIRYPLVWSNTKTNILLAVLFIVSVLLSVPVVLTEMFVINDIIQLYLWPVLDFTFLLTAVVTYTYFFAKIRRLRSTQTQYASSSRTATTDISIRRTNTENSTNNTASTKGPSSIELTPQGSEVVKVPVKRQTSSNITKKIRRGFFTPTLLIITFVIFWLIPDQINFWDSLMAHFYDREVVSRMLQDILKNLYPLGFISDAIIYIFLQKEVITFLKRKISNAIAFK